MPEHRACANSVGLPTETLAEIHDGIALALDSLSIRRPDQRRVTEALGHPRYGGMTPESLITRAARTGYHAAALVERLMRDRPHPEQGNRSALGVLGLQRQFGADRLEAACERALTVGTVNYASVRSILITAPPVHDNFRGPGYYQ